MKENCVSLKVAKQLKEKGFDWPCDNWFVEVIEGNEREEWDENECAHITKKRCKIYTKPTLYMAQKWLREIKGIHITIDFCTSGYYPVLWKTNGTFISTPVYKEPTDGLVWDIYEDALHVGILEALNFI